MLAGLTAMERDDRWLSDQLRHVWERHFSDTPRANQVHISFARCWKNRLGLITLGEDSGTTYIRLNLLLCHPLVPDFVNLITIAHELVHYAHGFGSPLPRKYRHPHRGGVVPRELAARGLKSEYHFYQRWIAQHWFPFHAQVIKRLTNGWSGLDGFGVLPFRYANDVEPEESARSIRLVRAVR